MQYGIGDVHGCYDKFKTLVEKEIKINKNNEIICVGDIITKGSQNLELIEYILWLRKSSYNIKSVIGNHEYRILSLYYSDYEMFELYLEKYNCEDLLMGELNEIINLLESFPFYIEMPNWIIAHSYFSTDMSSQIDIRNMLGVSNFSGLSLTSIENKRQLYGHRAITIEELQNTIKQGSRLINIDTGCVYEEFGFLTAINLENMDVISI